MTQRPPADWPRLSGRPASPPRTENANQTVFRRFFDLIERLEKPPQAPASKGQPQTHGRAGKGRR
jgi:hypothetical protein